MIGRIAAALAIGTGLLAAATIAQEHAADVVVTARARPSAEVIRQRVRSVTRRTGDQVARFSEPVCAAAIGLPERYARKIAARITSDAKAAGAAVAGPGCRPNLTLVIVENGRLLLTELRRRKPALFNAMPRREVDRALAETGPARVITVTQLLSRDGNALSTDYTRGNNGLAGGAPTLLVNSASLIQMTTRQDITGSLVLLDTPAVMGRTLNQLADYAAMRALARTNATAADDDDTILSLFTDPAAAPKALTTFDRAFLKALYHGPPTARFNAKLADMARQIAAATN